MWATALPRRHAHQVVLKDLPQHFQSFTLSSAASVEEDMLPAPELQRTVLMRPAHESARIAIDPDNECAARAPAVLLAWPCFERVMGLCA